MPQMTGARYLAEALEAYGVTHVFMVPAVLRATLAEMERRTGIERVHAHGEKPAAYMADGYARASGRPGVCMAQLVGALNLAAGLRDAWLAHAPVLAFTGGPTPHYRYRGVYQDVEDLPAFDPVTKWNVAVDDVARFPDVLRQAFRESTSGCPGPVHVRFAGSEGEIDRASAELEPVVEERYASVPASRPAPEAGAVRAALECIAGAERPVIVAGGGVRASGAAGALQRFAEAAGVPVATSLNAKDCMPGLHSLNVGVPGTYSRGSANRVVHEADLVVFVGTSAGSMTTHFWSLPQPGTRAVQIDIDPATLGRNYPLTVAIQADARAALQSLTSGVSEVAPVRRNAWLERVSRLCEDWRAEAKPMLESDAFPIRPERICAELSALVPEDAIVIVDTGHAGMWMGGQFDLRSPSQSYLRSAGHLGWAFPAGLGAKCACPERPVVTFTGDLGLWYHIGEIETAVRRGINAVTVVNNNRSGNQSTRGFERAYDGAPTEKSRELWVQNEVDFARIAGEIGALGIRVTRPAELSGALARAFEAERPVIVDVVTDIEAIAPVAWTG